MTNFIQEYFEKNGIGQYPPEYNKAVHGRYDPARYYGKPDTKLQDVKLGELGAWLNRRNKSPRAITQAISRCYWRWQHRFWQPKRASMAGFYQLGFLFSVAFYIGNYQKKKYHQGYRYH